MSKLICLSLLMLASFALGIDDVHHRSSAFKLKDFSLKPYKLKFLTPHTIYPVKLLDHFGTYEVTNAILPTTKWFKYGSNSNIEHLEDKNLTDKYFTTEENTNGQVNLYLREYEASSNFILDHYEPRHYEGPAPPQNSYQNNRLLTNDNAASEQDDEYDQTQREIYTLVYLKSLEATVNKTSDNEYEIGCRLSLLLPVGLVQEHSLLINEEIENSVLITLKVQYNKSLDTDESSKRFHRRKRFASNKVKINSKLESDKGVDMSNENWHLFSMEITEGPIKVYKSNYKANDVVNSSCHLRLIDYDATHAFDGHAIKVNIFNALNQENNKPSDNLIDNLPTQTNEKEQNQEQVPIKDNVVNNQIDSKSISFKLTSNYVMNCLSILLAFLLGFNKIHGLF